MRLLSSSSMYVPYVMSRIPFVNGKIVIDVACGKGKWGYLVRTDRGGDNAYLIGCDAFKPYLHHVKEHAVYDDCILCDAKQLPYRDRIADVIIACEILEHLEKADGYKFLIELERTCKEKLIVTTPNVFVSQNKVESNIFQVHKSVWDSRELQNMGFDVHGIGFRGPMPPCVSSLGTYAFGLDIFMFSSRRKKFSKFLLLFYMLLCSFSFFLPRVSVFLVAEKQLRRTMLRAK